MKLKKEKEYDLISAIKDDTNGIIGTFVLSRHRTLKSPFKLKWNRVEPVIWTKELGFTVLTISNHAEPKLSRLIDLYPPKTWNEIVFLKPKWKYTEKQLIEIHSNIKTRLEHDGYKNLNCFLASVSIHRVANWTRPDGKDVFEGLLFSSAATIKHFTKNGNLQPIMLKGKES